MASRRSCSSVLHGAGVSLWVMTSAGAIHAGKAVRGGCGGHGFGQASAEVLFGFDAAEDLFCCADTWGVFVAGVVGGRATFVCFICADGFWHQLTQGLLLLQGTGEPVGFRGRGGIVDRFIGPQCFLGTADPGIEVIVGEVSVESGLPRGFLGFLQPVPAQFPAVRDGGGVRAGVCAGAHEVPGWRGGRGVPVPGR